MDKSYTLISYNTYVPRHPQMYTVLSESCEQVKSIIKIISGQNQLDKNIVKQHINPSFNELHIWKLIWNKDIWHMGFKILAV